MPEFVLTRSVDRLTLHFGPYGLGGALAPEVSAELLERETGRLVLPGAVPASVQRRFDEVRATYCDGLFRYSNFTSAVRLAYVVLEAALKVRFLLHYEDGLPIVVAGERTVVSVADWRQAEDLFRHNSTGARRRLAGHRGFNGSLRSLLRWARDERYLYGQLNRRREGLMVVLRNDLTHTEQDVIESPPSAYRDIRAVWEIICRLWETDPPAGVDYPPPVERVPLLLGGGPVDGEWILCPLTLLEEPPTARDEARVWSVVLADLYDRSLRPWWPGFETTQTPVTWLWGPGGWDELQAVAAVQRDAWQPDVVSLLDRVFFIRLRDGKAELPRNADQVKALRDEAEDEQWLIVQADHPTAALGHARAAAAGACAPRCACAVTVLRDRVKRHRVEHFIRVGLGALPKAR